MSYQSTLYQQVIIEHNKKPRNFRKIDDANTSSCEGNNPLCGDEITVYIKIDDKDIVEDVSFIGHGCAISKASSSMMTTSIKGKSLADVRVMFNEFHKMILGEFNPDKEANHIGKLKIFKGVCEFPARTKCATLPWHTLVCAIDDKKITSTE